MNYPTFLKEVDKLGLRCGPDELRAIVHELARTLSEENRSRFLDVMERFAPVGDQGVQKQQTGGTVLELSEQIREMLDILKGIAAGDRRLDSEYNEEWDDWYNSEEDEYRFSDPSHVLDDLEQAFGLLHSCVDQERYREGAELAESLSELTVGVSGDYEDYDSSSMSIDALVSYELLSLDIRKAVKEAAYLSLMGSAQEKRADSLHDVLSGFGQTDIMLDDILQIGSDEVRIDDFLPEWIARLAEESSGYDKKLLLEAVSMLPGDAERIEVARRYAETHPELFRKILTDGKEKGNGKMYLATGLEALMRIPQDQPVRASIALLTADYAIEMQEVDTAENCWMEAFRTAPSAVNLLRLLLETRNPEDFQMKARESYEAYYESGKSLMNQSAYAATLFYDGQFRQVLDRFMKKKEGIGWSGTFMKEGLALFLLLLNQGKPSGSGLKDMLSRASQATDFSNGTYLAGLGRKENESSGDKALFSEVFRKWKENAIVEDELRAELLKRIDRWIQIRVSAIMNANRRNYYGECAAYIAAFGEVQESLGIKGAKASLMERYRTEYSRRRAFHDELRRYGMRR